MTSRSEQPNPKQQPGEKNADPSPEKKPAEQKPADQPQGSEASGNESKGNESKGSEKSPQAGDKSADRTARKSADRERATMSGQGRQTRRKAIGRRSTPPTSRHDGAQSKEAQSAPKSRRPARMTRASPTHHPPPTNEGEKTARTSRQATSLPADKAAEQQRGRQEAGWRRSPADPASNAAVGRRGKPGRIPSPARVANRADPQPDDKQKPPQAGAKPAGKEGRRRRGARARAQPARASRRQREGFAIAAGRQCAAR